MNYMLFDSISIRLAEIQGKTPQGVGIDKMYVNLDNRKKMWDKYASQCESSYEYLTKRYHSGNLT